MTPLMPIFPYLFSAYIDTYNVVHFEYAVVMFIKIDLFCYCHYKMIKNSGIL